MWGFPINNWLPSRRIAWACPGPGPVSEKDTSINQGSSTLFLSSTTLSQPLTQLLKIHDATKIARSDQKVAKAEARQTENDVILAVHQLYYGLLVAGKQKEAAEAGLSAAQESQREAENAVRSRTLLEVSLNEGRTAVLQNKQSLLTADIQIADLNSELNNFWGCRSTRSWSYPTPAPRMAPLKAVSTTCRRRFPAIPNLKPPKPLWTRPVAE